VVEEVMEEFLSAMIDLEDRGKVRALYKHYGIKHRLLYVHTTRGHVVTYSHWSDEGINKYQIFLDHKDAGGYETAPITLESETEIELWKAFVTPTWKKARTPNWENLVMKDIIDDATDWERGWEGH
jgi:hypothetical protein